MSRNPCGASREIDCIEYLSIPYAVDGKEVYREPGEDFDSAAFYDMMRTNPTADIKTMARNEIEFEEFWQPYLAAGKDVFHLSFSSQLSSTYKNSLIASEALMKEFPGRKIVTIDSKQICLQQASCIIECARRRMEGTSLEELAKWCEANLQRFCVLFTVEDLSYLKRGGRLSGASASIGTLLSIKPLLRVSPAGGLEAIGKVRGRKKVLRAMAAAIAANSSKDGDNFIFVADAGCPDTIERIVQYLQDAGVTAPIYFSKVGPVIGAHLGPGSVIISYISKNRAVPEYKASATE